MNISKLAGIGSLVLTLWTGSIGAAPQRPTPLYSNHQINWSDELNCQEQMLSDISLRADVPSLLLMKEQSHGTVFKAFDLTHDQEILADTRDLKALRDYNVHVRNEDFPELFGRTLWLSVDREGLVRSQICCADKACNEVSQYLIFRVLQGKSIKHVGINPHAAELLKGAVISSRESSEESSGDKQKPSTKPSHHIGTISLGKSVQRTPAHFKSSAYLIMPEEIAGSLEYVNCSAKSDYENVIPVQCFKQSDCEKTEVRNGRAQQLIKVKMNGQIVWMNKEAVKFKSQCPSANKSVDKVEKKSEEAKTLTPPAAFRFPTHGTPCLNYTERPRAYGSPRANGRRHAAADIYRNRNEQVLAIEAGRVIRAHYYFYLGTYALEVKHASGAVVRYGEVTAQRPGGIANGRNIVQGQQVGFMGKVQCTSEDCPPMLHFEKYAGNRTGALTQPSRRPFQRRADLQDPTAFLTSVQSSTQFPPPGDQLSCYN